MWFLDGSYIEIIASLSSWDPNLVSELLSDREAKNLMYTHTHTHTHAHTHTHTHAHVHTAYLFIPSRGSLSNEYNLPIQTSIAGDYTLTDVVCIQ